MEKKSFNALLRQTVLIPVIALAILAAVLLCETQYLNNALQWVDHTDQVVAASEQNHFAQFSEAALVCVFALFHGGPIHESDQSDPRRQRSRRIYRIPNKRSSMHLSHHTFVANGRIL